MILVLEATYRKPELQGFRDLRVFGILGFWASGFGDSCQN